jgi:hypothetical protein
MKKSFLIIFLFSFNVFVAQEEFVSFKSNDTKEKDVFSIIDDSNNATIFIRNKTKIAAYQFNDSLEVKDSITTDINSKELKKIIGTSQKNNNFFVYWSTKKDNEIVTQSFDFTNKKTTKFTNIIDFDKEEIITRITVKNKFYIISVQNNLNIFNIYCFSGESLEKRVVDCSIFKFFNSLHKSVSFLSMFNEYKQNYYYSGLKNIMSDTPVSLVNCAEKKKVYIKENSIILTFDTNENFTQTLTINFDNFTASQKEYTLPAIRHNDLNSISSNSFLINDKIIQLKIDYNILFVLIKDLDGNEIKSFTLKPDQEIDFKNSDIIQEEGSIKTKKTLDTSRQLIRKIYNMNISVSCFYKNDSYYMVIGGVSFPQQTSYFAGMGGGLTGALMDAFITNNYSVNNINSYSNKKIVYIYSLFDQDFNHLKGTVNQLAFDKLRLFVERNNKFINQTVFNIGSKIYYFGQNKNTKYYCFYVFED